MKKIVEVLMLFIFAIIAFVPFSVYGDVIPKKGDLRYQGITSYIDADSNGLDTGLVNKENQYT